MKGINNMQKTELTKEHYRVALAAILGRMDSDIPGHLLWSRYSDAQKAECLMRADEITLEQIKYS